MNNENIAYRYPGSKPFEKKDKGIFFGRDNETLELYDFICVNSLTVLYATSGVGKSSLLNAGLLPKLEAKQIFWPIEIRFETGNKDMSNPIQKIITDIKETNEKYKEKIDVEIPNIEDNLWTFFKTHRIEVGNKSVIPLLIFDQFEQFFDEYKNGKENNHIQTFATNVADILRDRVPEVLQDWLEDQEKEHPNWKPKINWREVPIVHFLIIIRSDRLSELDLLSSSIPSILRNRYYLKPLTRNKAITAIKKPAELYKNKEKGIIFNSPCFEYNKEVIDAILTYKINKSNDGEVDLNVLQIFSEHIENKVLEKKLEDQKVTLEYLGGKEGMKKIIEQYYENRINKLPDKQQEYARYIIEELLLSGDGSRRVFLENDIVRNLKEKKGRSHEFTYSILEQLSNSKINLIKKVVKNNTTIYEISHDFLCIPIANAKKEKEEKRKGDSYKIIRLFFLLILVLISVIIQKNEVRKKRKSDISEHINEMIDTSYLEKDLVLTINKIDTFAKFKFNNGNFRSATSIKLFKKIYIEDIYKKDVDFEKYYQSTLYQLAWYQLFNKEFEKAKDNIEKIKRINTEMSPAPETIIIYYNLAKGNLLEGIELLEEIQDKLSVKVNINKEYLSWSEIIKKDLTKLLEYKIIKDSDRQKIIEKIDALTSNSIYPKNYDDREYI